MLKTGWRCKLGAEVQNKDEVLVYEGVVASPRRLSEGLARGGREPSATGAVRLVTEVDAAGTRGPCKQSEEEESPRPTTEEETREEVVGREAEEFGELVVIYLYAVLFHSSCLFLCCRLSPFLFLFLSLCLFLFRRSCRL